MSEKILIVENDREQCDWFKKKLKERFEEVGVYSCNGKEEAIKILKKNKINVVITDMRMPRLEEGYSLLRFVKIRHPKTQVIVYTAYPDWENAKRCMRAGCFDYIDKSAFIDRDDIRELLYCTQSAIEASRSILDIDSLTERLIISEWKEFIEKDNADDKGKALENLCYLLFGSIPGWEEIQQNVRSSTEEFDLVIINESKNETWKKYGTIILLECKNWIKNKPGKNELGSFLNKIRSRNSRDCRLGFFISANGFTKTFQTELYKISQDDICIIPLKNDDLRELVFSEDRNGFLKELLCKQLLS
jgi:YesN/AraC family two-component response regulator